MTQSPATPRAGAELLAAQEAVCSEIQRIMATYREQEAERGYVDTPGGLEHMGDVWRLLAEWDDSLRAALQRPAQPAAEGGVELGKCDVTLTERYANPACVCATYAGNKGPCRSWEAGVNGRCVYCDHTMACHLEMCQAALASPAPASAEVEQVASALENGVLPIGFLDKAAALLRRLDAERGVMSHNLDLYVAGATKDSARIAELKAELAALQVASAGVERIAKYADIPVVASEPLETCCFCNKTIQLGQAYDRLDAGRYCHLGCWPPAAALQAAPAARDVERVEQAAEAWVLAERALHKDNSKANAHRWAEAETVFRVAIAALPHDAPAVAEELPVPPDARARAAQREPLGDTKRGT